MSFVIQNFYTPNKNFLITSKIKNYLILINLPKLLIFLKFNTLIMHNHEFGFEIFFKILFKYFFNTAFKISMLSFDHKN